MAVVERDGLFRRRRTDGRRGNRVVIAHTDAEYARVKSIATQMGISIPRLYEQSLYAGDTAAAAHLTSLLMELRIAMRLMGSAANNLNQLARAANTGGDIHWPQIEAAAELMQSSVKRVEGLISAIPAARAFDVEGA